MKYLLILVTLNVFAACKSRKEDLSQTLSTTKSSVGIPTFYLGEQNLRAGTVEFENGTSTYYSTISSYMKEPRIF